MTTSVRAIDDPGRLAVAARIMRNALARHRAALTPSVSPDPMREAPALAAAWDRTG